MVRRPLILHVRRVGDADSVPRFPWRGVEDSPSIGSQAEEVAPVERPQEDWLSAESRPSAVAALLLLSVALTVWPVGVAAQGTPERSSEQTVHELIDRAVAAREQAFKAIPRARGTGTYRHTSTDEAGKVFHEVRAKFRMAYDYPKEFIQFRYQEVARHDDCYARVVMSNGEQIYESLFYEGYMPHGVEGKVTKPIEKGLLEPVLDVSCGYLTKAHGYVHLLRELHADISVHADGKLKVLRGKYPNSNGYQEAFWIDPSKAFHIVRFQGSREKTTGPPQITTDITHDWAQKGTRWFVKRCTKRHVQWDEDDEVHSTRETELVLDTFEPDVSIPNEVFTVHAIGLVHGARIRQDEPRIRWSYTADPEFDKRKVEKVVGELPMLRPHWW